MVILQAAPNQQLAGTSEVENLQKALKSLAQVTGNPSFDPGAADGVVGDKTVAAVATVLPELASYLSSTVSGILTIGIAGGMAYDSAKTRNLVSQYATPLTAAVLAVIAKKAVGGGATTPNAGAVKANALANMQSRLQRLLNPVSYDSGAGAGAMTSNTVWALDPEKGYRVAQPMGLQGPLGKAKYIEIGIYPTQPTSGTQIPLSQYLGLTGQAPWYKTWWGMTGIGVGAVGFTFLIIKVVVK